MAPVRLIEPEIFPLSKVTLSEFDKTFSLFSKVIVGAKFEIRSTPLSTFVLVVVFSTGASGGIKN